MGQQVNESTTHSLLITSELLAVLYYRWNILPVFKCSSSLPHMVRPFAVSLSIKLLIMALEQNISYPGAWICSTDFHGENRGSTRPQLLGEAPTHGHVSNDLRVSFVTRPRTGIKAIVLSLRRGSAAYYQSLYNNSFAVMRPRLWNCLPIQINTITTFDLFKQKLTSLLLRIPDQPPVLGYTPPNSNSILDWRMEVATLEILMGGHERICWPIWENLTKVRSLCVLNQRKARLGIFSVLSG